MFENILEIWKKFSFFLQFFTSNYNVHLAVGHIGEEFSCFEILPEPKIDA